MARLAANPTTIKLSGGQTIVDVHMPGHCAGSHCTIHNPSDHHLRDWDQVMDPMAVMYRECPKHRNIHIDPDDPSWRFQLQEGFRPGNCRLGCCGCCAEPVDINEVLAELTAIKEGLE